MVKYLVTFNDVFNFVEINGFTVMTEKEADSFEKLAETITWDFTYPLNGEGELEFSSGEDLLSKLDFREISNEQYKVMDKLFNEPYGVFITEDFLQDLLAEEPDDYDESEDLDEDWGGYGMSFEDE